jgi:hypothetical protein
METSDLELELQALPENETLAPALARSARLRATRSRVRFRAHGSSGPLAKGQAFMKHSE